MFKIDHRCCLKKYLENINSPNSAPLEQAFMLNGALYYGTKEFILREKSFINQDTLGYVMPSNRSVDIDTNFDWSWAEYLMNNQIS